MPLDLTNRGAACVLEVSLDIARALISIKKVYLLAEQKGDMMKTAALLLLTVNIILAGGTTFFMVELRPYLCSAVFAF